MRAPEATTRTAGAWQLAALALALYWGGVVGAQDLASRLLPPERAFALRARGLDERTVEAEFAIADGYYLYRSKLRFSAEPKILGVAPALPPGKQKHDEFFGDVEVYRGRLVVRLPLERASPGREITLQAESQGCADAGICYPPTVQKITLALPAAGSRPGELIEANPVRKSFLN